MRVLNLEQGSEEWLRARMGVATASNFSAIVTSKGELSKTLSKYALQLASELLLDKVQDTYKNQNMQRGNDLEPIARQAYQEQTISLVDECGFMLSDCKNFGYSPDGLLNQDGLIEIKCPTASIHTKYLIDNRVPVEYWQQCQGGLMVSGRKYLDFISYHPDFKDDKKLFIKRVERDEEFIEKLKLGIDKVIELRDEYLTRIMGVLEKC